MRVAEHAVTFDLWQTLLFEKNGTETQRNALRCRNLAETLAGLNIFISTNQVKEALGQTISDILKLWKKNKDLTHERQLKLLIKHATNSTKHVKSEWVKSLSAAYISGFVQIPPYLNPDARMLFQWLREHQIRIGLICNTGLTPSKALREFLVKEKVAHFFDVMIFSNEVGIRKPDPRIFKLAQSKLRVEANMIVHIGDNVVADVSGAKNAGLRAFHLMTKSGRDKCADEDPSSLVSLSRALGKETVKHMPPDAIIESLRESIPILERLWFSTIRS